jgi:hypothetical protein
LADLLLALILVSVEIALIPQPLSTQTAFGMTPLLHGITPPIGILYPEWQSGMSANVADYYRMFYEIDRLFIAPASTFSHREKDRSSAYRII